MNTALTAVTSQEYKYGFVTDIESDSVAAGLNEDVIRFISAKKGEPEWLLEFRLKAYRHWLTMAEPEWANVHYVKPDFQAIVYYSAPKKKTPKYASMDEVDPELLRTFEKLGVPMNEQAQLAGVAVDVVFDSVSVTTTYKEKLATVGIIFCSFSEAVREHPDLIKKYLGSVVPTADNFYAALNSAVFTDGSFVFIPRGVTCPMDLSTYFRINNKESGQFERTLIVAEEGASVSYLEGCTAPQFDTNQLHAAVVELVALDDASIKYSTVQNWYAGDKNGLGGIFNFVTKRGLCKGRNSKISWTQVETGSAITWKYPSCVLLGENSIGEFYSVALTNHKQQADTGTKMIHIGRNTKSTIISKGISARRQQQFLPRPGARTAQGDWRAQFQPVRFHAHRPEFLGEHLSLHRSSEQVRQGGARSHHQQDRRRTALLFPAARHPGGRRHQHDHQWLLQGCLPRAPHGIRRGSHQVAELETRRQCRLIWIRNPGV